MGRDSTSFLGMAAAHLLGPKSMLKAYDNFRLVGCVVKAAIRLKSNAERFVLSYDEGWLLAGNLLIQNRRKGSP